MGDLIGPTLALFGTTIQLKLKLNMKKRNDHDDDPRIEKLNSAIAKKTEMPMTWTSPTCLTIKTTIPCETIILPQETGWNTCKENISLLLLPTILIDTETFWKKLKLWSIFPKNKLTKLEKPQPCKLR